MATMTFLIGRYSLCGEEWAKRERTHALLTANRPRPPRTTVYLNILRGKRKKMFNIRNVSIHLTRQQEVRHTSYR